MNRRNFLRFAGGTLAAGRQLAGDLVSDRWRIFELNTRIELLKPSGPTRVWLPEVHIRKMPFQRSVARELRAEGGTTEFLKNSEDGLGITSVEFPAGVKPSLSLISRIATKNHVVDLATSGKAVQAHSLELQHFLRPTKLVPTEGIVRETAVEITRGTRTDLDKAHAIYDWIVDNTFRDPKTRGCGRGDIRFMLESKNLGGKCADLNTLYVGLARAVGLPARDVYGIRVAK